MDSVIRGTLVFFIVITFSTFLWGVFVAYRTGLVGQRYAKHRKPQIQEQYIDLEQAFDASLSSGKSETMTLAPSFYKASNTPSVTSLTSLHFRARSCVVPTPTPSESLSRVPHHLNEKGSQQRRPWWVKPEDDFSDTEESFGEEIQKYVHNREEDKKGTPPREITMSADGNVAVDREALQAHVETFQPSGKMQPAPKYSSSAALSKWARHQRSSPEPRLTYKPSSLRHCLSLDSDVPFPPELSKSPTSPQFPSEIPEPVDHESEQSHAYCPPAGIDPREFIAYGSPLRDSQIFSQNHPFLSMPSCAAVECEESFKQCMTSQGSDADSASDVPFSAAATHSPSFDAVVSPCPHEERDSYFMMDYDDDMQALKRPLSMLYATVKNRMQADSIPRANTDSCLLRVSR